MVVTAAHGPSMTFEISWNLIHPMKCASTFQGRSEVERSRPHSRDQMNTQYTKLGHAMPVRASVAAAQSPRPRRAPRTARSPIVAAPLTSPRKLRWKPSLRCTSLTCSASGSPTNLRCQHVLLPACPALHTPNYPRVIVWRADERHAARPLAGRLAGAHIGKATCTLISVDTSRTRIRTELELLALQVLDDLAVPQWTEVTKEEATGEGANMWHAASPQ